MDKSYLITTYRSADSYSKKHVFQAVRDSIVFEASSFFLPKLNRYDLCISSTAGCSLGCKICQCSYSAVRHDQYDRVLTSAEIMDQIDFLLQDGKEFITDDTMVLVGFMGNGDPFNNTVEIVDAIKMSHNQYHNIVYRYGISTIGVNLAKSIDLLTNLSLKEKVIIWLQFSLISTDEDIRKDILPNSPPIIEAVPLLDQYSMQTGNPVRYNFPMIEGINNSTEDLNRIVKFVSGNPQTRMVKLSTYNEISNKIYRPCSDDVIEKSAEYLRKQGVKVDVFYGNRDKEVRGSCGQLRELPLISKPHLSISATNTILDHEGAVDQRANY